MSITMNDEIVGVLNRLIRLNQASELGFETAAEHVRNRGLKLHLKRYARQRARFLNELRHEIMKWGGVVQVTRNPWAALHRGWIDIKAALTVGRDSEARVVLSECLRGERVALKHYQQARQAILPVTVDEFLERQAVQVQAVHDQLCAMMACHDEELLVQLFDNAQTAELAMARLNALGVVQAQMQLTPVAQTDSYDCARRRQRLLESGSAGALSGAVGGLLMGLIASLGLLVAGVYPQLASPAALLLVAVGIGAATGALFGLLIGQGVTEDDAYVYKTSMRDGGVVLTVQIDRTRSPAVRQLLRANHGQELQTALASTA